LKKQADSKKSGVDQKKAAQKALIYTCTVCKTQMQNIRNKIILNGVFSLDLFQ